MERFQHGGDVYAHPGVLDFSSNLNPLGMPGVAREALLGCIDACAAYPDPACRALTRSIAAYEHVEEGWVLACAGATDAFARICLALRPRRALLCAPSYVGYEQALEQVGASVGYVSLREEDGFAVGGGLLDAVTSGVDLVFVANPNNPTGRCVERGLLVALLEAARRVGATVVLDECFIDLTQREGSVALLEGNPNLVLVKALTKTFALAGLRVGYALCSNAALLERLREAGQPWAVGVPAQAAGVACLEDRSGYLERSRALIACERARLQGALEAVGLMVVPSDANYLLWKAGRNLSPTFLEHGVMVRSCDNYQGLDGRWHRSAVRSPEENDVFIDTLREVVG